MKLTIITIGSRSDIQPIVALGKGLIKAGYEVTIATHAPYILCGSTKNLTAR